MGSDSNGKPQNLESTSAPQSGEQLTSPKLPVPLFLWQIFLVLSVFLYSSYTIFVHLCEVDGKLPFRSTALVLLVEVLKLILSMIMYTHTRDAWSCHPERNVIRAARTEIRQNYQLTNEKHVPLPNPPPLTWKQLMVVTLPFTVPAVLYAVNNNLGIFIQLEMDPATYQVLGNFKILSTAILFRLIINRPITPLRWFALFLLLCAGLTHSYGSLLAKKTPSSPLDSTEEEASALHRLHITPTGIMMIALYCTLSGLSGVYTEYVMKKRAKMSIHLQNGLLYIFGIILNGILYIADVLHSPESNSWNPFMGFNLWTWLLLFTQAIVGIFMGFVMKYSTNITRLFIISSAMLVTTVSAMLIFGLTLNVLFVVSFLLVCTSLYLYHRE